MANLIINENKEIKGKMTVSRRLDISKDPPVMTIYGQLETHRYIEEIESIKSDRYLVDGVTVIQESFGSDDFNIVYTFVAESIEVSGGETNLSENQINHIETEIYGGEQNV